MDKFCEYCGNTSGYEDSYGNCRSCGGNLTRRPATLLSINAELPRDYSGVSGWFGHISDYEYYRVRILTIGETWSKSYSGLTNEMSTYG